MIYIIPTFLAFSLVCNALLLFFLHRQKKTPRKPQLSMSAEDLLHDLTRRGTAVLKVEVIDPANLYLRRTR